jgi:glyoxylase-like metal-dependent hydrolase (beta-lactamase superfamily II)
VHILSTPGHTAGHQSVLVDTDEGGVLLAGQAVYSLAEYEGREPLEATDPSYAKSVELLRSLNARRVFVSHDARVWDAEPARRAR